MLRLILESEGYEIVEAAHGEAALGMMSLSDSRRRLRHKPSSFTPYCAVVTEKGKGYCLVVAKPLIPG